MTAKKMKSENDDLSQFVRRHLLAGWTGLLVFLILGIALETLHGLKINLYLDVRNETRRLMWTLAHAHGTLLSLVHIVFALSLSAMQIQVGKYLQTASVTLICSLLTMPLGFFLGGVWLYGGDPGLGVLLVPVGALLMLFSLAVFLCLVISNR